MNIKDLQPGSFQQATPPGMNANSLTPGSYKEATPHSMFSDAQTNLSQSQGLMDRIGSAANTALRAVPSPMEFSIGAGKELIKTGQGAGTAIAGAASHIPGPVGQFFGGAAQEGQAAMQSPDVNPSNLTQRVGGIAADVASFAVPGEAESALATKVGPALSAAPQAIGLTGKVASGVSGALRTGLKAITGGLSMAGVTAAQTGGDAEKTKQAAVLGGITGAATGALDEFATGWLQSSMRNGFKQTPAAEATKGKIMNEASQFMAENKVLGTDATKLKTLTDVTKRMNQAVVDSLPPNVYVSSEKVVAKMEQSLQALSLTDQAAYRKAAATVEEAKSLLDEHTAQYASEALSGEGVGGVSLKQIRDFKTSWGDRAFKASQGAAATRNPQVLDDGAYIVEQAYDDALKETLDSVKANINIPYTLRKYFGGQKAVAMGDFNKVFSSAINARKLTNIGQFRSMPGIFDRLTSILVGQSLAGPVGAIAGDMLPGPIMNVARNVSQRALANPELPTTAARVGQGIENNLSSQQNQNQ